MKYRRRLINISDGQQIAIEDTKSVQLDVTVDGTEVESEQELDMNQKEFAEFIPKLGTHKAEFDIMSKKITLKKRVRSKNV